MSAGQTLGRAHKAMMGVSGGIALCLEARAPVPRGLIQAWVARLRRAADELEKLL